MGIHRVEFGLGDPAVFVHGSFGWGLDTFPEQRALADRFRVVLVDRAGFGDSPAGDVVGWPTDVDDLIEVLGECKGAHLVGQSYGAVVSLLAAGRRPDLVRSLVVIEPPVYSIAADHPAVQTVVAAERRLREGANEMSTPDFVRGWGAGVMGRDPEAIDEWTAGWTPKDWAAADATRRERWPGNAPLRLPALARLSVPKVVVVGGWRADLFPRRQSAGRALRVVAEALTRATGSRLIVFDRSAHNPQLEEPAAFNALLRETWTMTLGRPPAGESHSKSPKERRRPLNPRRA